MFIIRMIYEKKIDVCSINRNLINSLIFHHSMKLKLFVYNVLLLEKS